MSQERFKENTSDSFYGRFLYEQVVPKDHFLVKLNEIIPWQRFAYKLVKYYKGKAKEGRPPYDPAVILKMLLVSYLYNISERQTEEVANLNLAVKYFLGLGVNEHPPDHTTLTAFKKRILENGNLMAYEKLFKEIIAIALEKGIQFGSIQVIDSVHTVADVNVEKDEKRQKDGQPPRDGSARWGVKGKRVVKDERGRKRKERLYFYGYKGHVSMNAQCGLITTIRASPGSAYDGHYLPSLIESDLEQSIPVEIVAADRGYDDGENHKFLREKGIASAVHLNSYRTQKKDKNKEIWVKLKESPSYQKGIRERGKIEGKFGEMKEYHGFGRCRYLGLLRYAIQGYLTAIAVNLKRIVKLLTGVGFKGPKKSCLSVTCPGT